MAELSLLGLDLLAADKKSPVSPTTDLILTGLGVVVFIFLAAVRRAASSGPAAKPTHPPTASTITDRYEGEVD